MPAGVARDECDAPCRQGPANSHVHGLVKVAPAAVDPDDRDRPSGRDKRVDQRAVEPNPIFGVGAYEALLVLGVHLHSSMPRGDCGVPGDGASPPCTPIAFASPAECQEL